MEHNDVKPLLVKYILVHIWKCVYFNIHANYNYLFGDFYFCYIRKVNYTKRKIFMNYHEIDQKNRYNNFLLLNSKNVL